MKLGMMKKAGRHGFDWLYDKSTRKMVERVLANKKLCKK